MLMSLVDVLIYAFAFVGFISFISALVAFYWKL